VAAKKEPPRKATQVVDVSSKENAGTVELTQDDLREMEAVYTAFAPLTLTEGAWMLQTCRCVNAREGYASVGTQ
jgi:hypothetical protein